MFQTLSMRFYELSLYMMNLYELQAAYLVFLYSEL